MWLLRCLAVVAVAAGLRAGPPVETSPAGLTTRGSKPSVLIIFVDDWGWGDMGANCLNAAAVPGAQPDKIDKETSCDTATGRSITPHLDSIAASGIRFTDFHVGAAVCTPSRAALQTGRMGARTGVTSNFQPGSLGGLPLGELTIAEHLKTLPGPGYLTAAIGKWHLGPQGKFAPTARGYDSFLGIPESIDYGCTDTAMGAPDSGCLHWQHDRCPRNKRDTTPLADQSTTCHPGPVNPWNYSIPLMHGVEVLQQPADLDGTSSADGVHLSLRYAQFATEVMRNATAQDRPFFIYMPYSHMHVPIVHSPQYTGKSGKGVLGDALMELDDSVGMVLQGLEDTGRRNDTIIFVTGDNGPPQDQCDWGGSVGPFLGQWQKTGQKGGSSGKLTSWEGGHREVGLVSWPGKVTPNAVSHVLASSLDYLPTILALAGVPLPTDRDFDGLDLAPVIFAKDPSAAPADSHHTSLFFSVGGESYPEAMEQGGLVGGGGEALRPTGLFEAVRLPGVSAMYKVGYMAQCCRGANGDANTPYNATCAIGGALGYLPTWLDAPLLFDLTVDVAQSTPLKLGTAAHTAAWRAVNASVAAMHTSLMNDKHSTADYHSRGAKICCNPDNVVCRCTEKP